MAGLQYCCRKLLIHNTSRLFNRNGVLFQPHRKRHHIFIKISMLEARMVFKKSKLLFNKDKQLLYRLASTSVNVPKGAVSDTIKPENLETTEPVQLKSEAGVIPPNSNVVIEESTLPPAPVSDVTEAPVLEWVSTGLKEPSFESLGLGSWWPSGMVQQLLEFLHINCDLPWWQSIVVVTILVRIALFPVNLSVRRDTVNMVNHIPTIFNFQQKILNAKKMGDFYSVATISMDMEKYMRENKVNLFSVMKTAIFQGPVFLAMLYGLRGMANLPVESLKTGGLFWFTDLTTCDPYYLLPVILSSTLLLVIEVGAEGNPARASNHTMKWVMRAVPLVVFVASINFPSCVTWYWTVSNVIVLGQVALFKIPSVAAFFKIPKSIEHASGKGSMSSKGFIEGFKEGFANARITAQMEDRLRYNLNEFRKAGSSSIPRTFKRNPRLENEKK